MVKNKLRKEKSENCSGVLLNKSRIPLLKERDYIIKPANLDGDAPKQLIKAYQFTQDSRIRRSSSKSWDLYIAKTAEKWYPHESVIEYLINRIGQVLGLRMNEIRLVHANGQIRFMSKYFLKEDESLIHGAEICGEHLRDLAMAAEIAKHKDTARELFTFEFIRSAIIEVFNRKRAYENILLELVKMIVFDAIVGNNDRHFYNWGVIANTKKTQKLPNFAPVFDSARGLLWNYSDQGIINFYNSYRVGGKKFVSYIEGSQPRISIEQNIDANHFELIQFIKHDNVHYAKIVTDLTNQNNEKKVLEMFKDEFSAFFIKERNELIAEILKERFKRIRRI